MGWLSRRAAPRSVRSFLGCALALVTIAPAACRDAITDSALGGDDATTSTARPDADVSNPDAGPAAGKTIGATCGPDAQCRFGLDCLDGTCVVVADTPGGQPCITTAECADDNHCGLGGVCTPAGDGGERAPCTATSDCARGLVCTLAGLGGRCVTAGTGDVGAPCDALTDCRAGLRCDADGACAAGNLRFGWEPWDGATCVDPDDDEGPARVVFELPREGAPPADFFALPYPNDVRLRDDGGVDLDGFPTPGPGLLGVDLVARLLAVAEREGGWPLVPTIYFRFSHDFDLGTLWAQGLADPPPGEPTLYLVDITPGSPTYNSHPTYGYYLTDGRGRYICSNYVAVRPAWETPLQPSTTYAVIIASGVRDSDGALLVADTDFPPLLAPTPPDDAADPALARAWQRYEPLRAYLATADAVVDASRVIGATVFTTRDPTRTTAAIRAAVRAVPSPVPTEVTLCDAGVQSPCDDGLAGVDHVRGCFAADPLAHELHMRVPLPILQRGQRPYLDPSDGGDLARDATGAPTVDGTEDVCVSVTIPRNRPMPSTGWPLVVYGHGTGGSFRSAVRDVGLTLADVQVGDLATAAAVVSWDGPMHGERRGADLPPEDLFFNAANPAAARGNAWQGAADFFALVHAFEGFTIDAAASPTGAAIRFDTSAIVHVGHSQGAATGALASPFEPNLALDVWSGAGGGLVPGILGKTRPVDARAILALALGEVDDEGLADIPEHHPALGLIQHVFDPVDPLGYAALAIRTPPPGGAPAHHVMHVHGVGDSYTPFATVRAFARLLGVHPSTPVLESIGGPAPEVDPPVTANITRDGAPITAVFTQAAPDGYDGHFVLFRDAALRRQFAAFVGSFVAGDVPTLIPR